MKKILTLAVTFVIVSMTAHAQFTFLGKANQHTVYGGENGKLFAAIFSTNYSSRQEAMEKTVDFLVKHDLVQDKERALSSVKEYDDTASEFEVPVVFRFGWHGTAPTMGAVAPRPPVFLKADLLFQFYDEGKVRLIIKNFSESGYMEYYNNCKKHETKLDPEEILTKEDYEDFHAAYITPTIQDGLGKGIMKFLIVANAGADRISSFYKEIDDYYHNIDRHIEVTQKLADAGYYILGTPEEIVSAYRKLIADNNYSLAVSMLDKTEQEIAEEKLVFVYDLFWRRDIKKQFDLLFIVVNQNLGGRIEAVAEDGEVTWQLEGDSLLPVDSKLKKKLQKAGQDYFTYYDTL